MNQVNLSTNLASHSFDLVIGKILTSRLSLSKQLAHNLGNLLVLGKIGVFHNRRNASSRLLLLISKHLIFCIYLVFRILALSRRLKASNLFLILILHLGNLFLIVQLHLSKLFLLPKSGVNPTSRGSISTRNRTRDGLIRVRNIRALNGRFNTSITHAYSIVIGSKHITLNATGGGFLTAAK